MGSTIAARDWDGPELFIEILRLRTLLTTWPEVRLVQGKQALGATERMEMAETPEAARRQAFRDATDWFILLQEDPDDKDLHRRIDAWRSSSDLNEMAWHATERTAEVASAMTPAHADEWGPDVLRRRASARRHEEPRARRLSRRIVGLSLAGVALAACLAMLAVPSLLIRVQADQTTAVAEQRVLDLQDGSRITLAPSSAIAVEFRGDERRIRLLDGQAFFEVRPDPDRPFRVHAGGIETSVLGTSFEVRLDSGAVTVAVREGVVQVATGKEGRGNSESLIAGETMRFDAEGRFQRSTEPTGSMAAWRQGQLTSHDRPLSEAVDMLRRYYGGSILVTDDALGARTVTGVYNLADPEEALRGMVQTHGGKVRRITPWLLVVSGW